MMTHRMIWMWLGLCGVLLGVGACSQGALDLKLVPAFEQKMDGVTRYSFRFSGSGLTEPASQDVDLSSGPAALPALSFNSDAENPDVSVQVVGYDSNDKIVAFGATRSAFAPKDISLRVLMSRAGRFGWTTRLSDRSQSVMTEYVVGHQVVALKDGRILIIGGTKEIIESKGLVWVSGGFLKRLFIYEPRSGTFIRGPELSYPRAFHTATVLKDGRILIAGGIGKVNDQLVALSSTEIFDPETEEMVSSTTFLSTSRAFHTATKLKDGSILFVGGIANPLDPRSEDKDKLVGQEVLGLDLYDAGTGKISKVSGVRIQPNKGRFWHKAVAFDTGEVLISGGLRIDAKSTPTAMKDPLIVRKNGATWQILPLSESDSAKFRFDHHAVKVEVGGKEYALVTGGRDSSGKAVPLIELWNSNGKLFVNKSPKLRKPRYGHTVLALPNSGRFMVLGGVDENNGVIDCEILEVVKEGESVVVKNISDNSPSLLETKGRYQARAAYNPLTQQIFMFGGAYRDKNSTFRGLNSAEFYMPMPVVSEPEAK